MPAFLAFHSTRGNDRPRISDAATRGPRTLVYEIRTYQIAPGSLVEVEKRFGEAYEHRKKFSPITAFLHTELGPLNEIVHIWAYKSLDSLAIRSFDQSWSAAVGAY